MQRWLRVPAALGLALVLVTFAVAQAGPESTHAHNVEVVGSVGVSGRSCLASGTWTDYSTGRELVCVVADDRVALVDAGALTLLATIPFASGSWSRASAVSLVVFAGLAFVGSDTNPGLLVIDLRSWVLAGTVTATGWSGTASLALDARRGILHCALGAGGVWSFDIGTTPVTPRPLSPLTSAPAWDLAVHGDLCALADVASGVIRMLDTSSGNAIVGTLPIPVVKLAFTCDGSHLIASTTASGDIVAIDVTNPAVPLRVGVVAPGVPPGIGSFAVFERVLHVVGAGGYRVVDLSDMTNPVDIAHLSGGLVGTHVDPTAPSGLVRVCDAAQGLFILHAKASNHDYGPFTPGGNRTAPTLHLFGAPWLGNPRFGMLIAGAPPSSNGFLVTAHNPATWNFGGLVILVDPVNGPGSITPLAVDSGGRAAWFMPVPTAASYIGRNLFSQFLALDASVPYGATASAGMTFQLHPR